MASRKEEIIKMRDEAQLAVQQLEHKLTKLKSEAKDAENHVGFKYIVTYHVLRGEREVRGPFLSRVWRQMGFFIYLFISYT